MKKKILLWLVAFMFAAVTFGVSACAVLGTNGGTESCKHNFEYAYDESEHNGVCIECGETTEGAHTFSGEVCKVCGYIKDNGDSETENFKTVAFDANGGEVSVKTKRYKVGELMKDLPTPTRKGYNFICWVDALDNEYTSASVMPNSTLSLKAKWEKQLAEYGDDYILLKPATEGTKNSLIDEIGKDNFVDKCLYVELTSDNLGGVDKVGETNNFNLRKMDGMEYKVKSGYTWSWYQGSFNVPNGAQLFTLKYGNNIQFITVSDGDGVVRQTYLLDIYLKHDYYINLYKNKFEEKPYDRIRVIENERFSSDTQIYDYNNGFEFDKRVYLNEQTGNYEEFNYTEPIREDKDLYQTYKPLTLPVDLDGGTLENRLTVTPYEKFFTLPSPGKENYDFLGWQFENGKYLTNVESFSGENYLSAENYGSNLHAVFAKKKMYYTFEDDVLQTFKTVPVVTYTDKTCTEILDIVYVPYGTDCVLPVKTAQTENTVFAGWQRYAKKDNGTFYTNPADFDFNKKVTSPLALFPETRDGYGYNTVPLNVEKTYREQGTYYAYLPTAQEYTLVVKTTGTVKFTLSSAQNTYEASYTADAENPASVAVACYVYELGSKKNVTGYVTVKILSLSGTFTASINGATAVTDGEPAVTNAENTVEIGRTFTPELDNLSQGYTFVGWFNGDKKVSDSHELEMLEKEFIYNAKWVYYTFSTVADSAEAGQVTKFEEQKITVGEEITVTAATNRGYTFVGWFDGKTKLTDELEYTFQMPAESKTYTAKWCKVTVKSSDSWYGDVSALNGKYKVGEQVTVTATTNNGYTFIGWFDGETKLTGEFEYTFQMPAVDKTYTAKWCKVTLSRNDSSAGSVFGLNGKYKVGDEVTVTATTNSGYTFVGWFDGETKLTGEFEYTFQMPAVDKTYTAKWCGGVTLTADGEGGEVPSLNDTKMGDLINVTVETYQGYDFLGWYVGEQKITDEETLTFEIKGEKINYSAKWTLKPEMNMFIFSSSVSDCEVTGLKDNSVKDLVIPNCVTKIGKDAFRNCRRLTSIIIPDSVTNIGYGAFYGTAWYEEQPDGLIYAGKVAYIYKGNLPDNTSIVIKDGTLGISDWAFSDCSGLTSIIIPDSVTSIGYGAFRECSGLASVTIGNSVTSIGNRAFAGCSGLTSIIIPDSVTSIGEDAFYGCSGLTSITLSDSLTSISNAAFIGCSGLTSIIIPDSVTSIDRQAFDGCSGLMSVTIGNSVTSIGKFAFGGCDGLTSIEFNNIASYCNLEGAGFLIKGAVYINEQKLYDITSLTIPDGVTKIGDSTFSLCGGLTSITIPDSVTKIGDFAFSSCSGLTSVTIPDSVTSIGNWAFSSCSGLTSITIPNSVASIGEGAFFYCSGLETVYWNATACKSAGSYDNPIFRDCKNLTTVIIGENVSTIPYCAFSGCIGLTSITIPDGVTKIGDSAFSGCSGLETVYWNATACKSAGSFGYPIFIDCENLTTVIIGENVTTMPDYVFRYCRGLTSITIPDSVTSIGWYALEGCSGLTAINYRGTKAQWYSMTKGHSWNYDTGNYTVHCSNGNLTKKES